MPTMWQALFLVLEMWESTKNTNLVGRKIKLNILEKEI